jgi:hypothetical protein
VEASDWRNPLINLRTAKGYRLTIPQSLLLRDRMIG